MAGDSADRLFLAVDQGTTSSRAIVFSSDGAVCSLGQVDLPVSFPQDGWVEQDPLQIWETQLEAIKQALAQVDVEQIACLGITNQRETTVVWDRQSGRPLAPAIVWQCRRTQELCQSLKDGGKQDFVRQKTGLILDPYFSASKIRWLYENYPDVQIAVDSGQAACGTVDSWVLYNLSNKKVFRTEASNASRTMLLSIHDCSWDDDMLSLWGIPKRVLPEVVHSAGDIASTSLFGPDIPITGILGDQQSALLGHGCVSPGGVKCTFGTGAFLLLNTGSKLAVSETGLLSTVAWQIKGQKTQYALEGSIFIAGAAVQWLRDQLGIIADSAETEAIAKSIDSSAGVVLVPSFTGLGAPHWDSTVRAAIFGMTRDTGRAHIVRAALEGCAHQLADVMEDENFDNTDLLRIDGGMSANRFFSQTVASLCQCRVETPSFTERTALGAARIAAIGSGECESLDEAVSQFRVPGSTNEVFSPELSDELLKDMRSNWKDAVRRLLC